MNVHCQAGKTEHNIAISPNFYIVKKGKPSISVFRARIVVAGVNDIVLLLNAIFTWLLTCCVRGLQNPRQLLNQ